VRQELERLSDFLVTYYNETGLMPVKNFKVQVPKPGEAPAPEPKMPICGAGKGHMAVSPDGELWGCFMFHDYFKTRLHDPQYKDYSYGTLTDFIAQQESLFPAITANYTELRQDMFQVKENFCFTCEDVESCMVWRVNAAYTTGSIGRISCGNCQLEKVQRKARRDFQAKILGDFIKTPEPKKIFQFPMVNTSRPAQGAALELR
ncbi:MAG: hypothetical protein GY940_14990, partial [bacterium]|nr:hypothetical protein [bacterium]